MKYIKTIILSLVILLLSIGIVFAAYPIDMTNWAVGKVITSTWLNSVETLLGSSPAKGGLLVATSTTQGYWLPIGSNGKILTASSTALSGVSWEVAASAIDIYAPGFITATSSAFYNQGFITSTSTAFIATSTGNWLGNWQGLANIYAPNFITATSTAFQSILTFPLNYASTTHISFPIPYASTTGVQNTLTFPIPVASTSLAVSAPIILTTNTLSMAYTPASSTLTLTAGSGLTGGGNLTADRTFNVGAGTNIVVNADDVAVTSTPSFTNITATGVASSTNLWTTNATTTNLGFSDGTIQKTAYKDIGFNVLNASTTVSTGASSTIQKIFYNAMTITQIDCSSDGANVTLVADERASSTPQTYGTAVFNGAGLVCSNTGASTTTFSNATIAANALLNFGITSVANSTTSLRTYIKYKMD